MVLLPQSPSAQSKMTDGQLTYCLSTGQAERMVETVLGLGLAEAGSGKQTLKFDNVPSASIGEWAGTKAEDFDRACKALIESASIGSSPNGGTNSFSLLINSLASTAIGALLALGSSEWSRSRERRRLDAASFRNALDDYSREAHQYIDAWTTATLQGTPDPRALDSATARLIRHLDRSRANIPRDFRVAEFKTRLDAMLSPHTVKARYLHRTSSDRIAQGYNDKSAIRELQNDLEHLAAQIESISLFRRRGALD